MAKPMTLRGLVAARNVRALTVELVVLAAVAAALFVYHREILSRVFGPFKVTVDEIAAIGNLDSEFRRYFRLDEGRIVEVGSHEELLETGRVYPQLFREQALESELEAI